jgi:hypothetical protein
VPDTRHWLIMKDCKQVYDLLDHLSKNLQKTDTSASIVMILVNGVVHNLRAILEKEGTYNCVKTWIVMICHN